MAKLLSGTRVYGNLTIDTFATATGNIQGGNLRTAGLISATGSITSAGGITGTGNVTGGNLTTAGLITATGNVSGGNIIAGTGSGGNITGANVITANAVTTTGNLTGGNLLTAGLISATGNLLTAGLISATGNLQAANGRFITSNVMVTINDSFAASSPTKNLMIVSGTRDVAVMANLGPGAYNNLTTANDSGLVFTGPQQGNANFVIVPWASGTSGIRISSVSNTATITLAATTTSATGSVTATGNVTGGNLITGGLITATGNIQGGNLRTAGLITATGNVTANNFIGNGFFTSFTYDDISSATDGRLGTFPLKYNQISQSISDPFALEVSVNGAAQSTFIWNSDVLWQTFALGTFKGYTIITTGKITFTNPPLPNSDVTIRTSFGKATTVTKRAPFLPADLMLGT